MKYYIVQEVWYDYYRFTKNLYVGTSYMEACLYALNYCIKNSLELYVSGEGVEDLNENEFTDKYKVKNSTHVFIEVLQNEQL